MALLLLVVLPLLYVGAMSFMGRGAYGGTIRRFTVDAYESLADFTYLKAVGRSICMALKSSVLCILLGYLFTFIVARKWKKSGKLLMFLLMIPVYTSSLARLYSLVIMFNSSGLINTALMKLHIISSPLQILYTNGSITIGLVQYLLPFAVMPLYSSIEKLDEATIEASYDLGAGKIKTFIKVILPMTFPGIIAAFIILFVPAIGTYFITDVIGGGTVYMIGNIICNQFLSARNWPLGAALSVCVVIFILLMLYLYSRIGNLDDLGAMLMKNSILVNFITNAYVMLIYVFVFIPVIVMVAFSFNSLPSNQHWESFTLDYYSKLFYDSEMIQVLINSLTLAVVSTLAAIFIGTLGAYALCRLKFKGRSFLNLMVFVPMVIPEIVIAVAFLGLTGAAGISKGFGVMVCAHTIFILPYIIVTLKSRFADYDVSIEEASLDLGANKIYTFIHIICPMILPGIFTGGLMAFSLSFDDLIVSNFLSNTGYTTLPVKIYSNLKVGISPEYNALFTIILAVMLIATAAIAIKKKRGK